MRCKLKLCRAVVRGERTKRDEDGEGVGRQLRRVSEEVWRVHVPTLRLGTGQRANHALR